jgi:hypothetical protein
MKRKLGFNSKAVLTWSGVALLSLPVLFMLASGPKPGLASGIAIALGAALLVLGSIRT